MSPLGNLQNQLQILNVNQAITASFQRIAQINKQDDRHLGPSHQLEGRS